MAQLKTGSTVNGIAIVVTNDSRLSDARTPLAHTQAASTITDFDTEVSNNEDVAANTAARHSHTNKTILDNTTASFTTADETKLAGIEEGATNYIHPANHPPSIITQDSSNRFVTDVEKSTWNNKASFKNGSSTFPAGTTHTVTDAFITANTLVTVIPTGTNTQNWIVDSTAGSFTITAEAAEPSSVTFDWGALK